MIISVQSHILAAVQAACAGKNDPRENLRGWHLDTSDPAQAWIVGTSGHAMLAAPVVTVSNDDKPSESGVIFQPIKVTRTKKPHDVWIDTRTMEATAQGKGQILTTIEGAFPDWTRILGGIEKRVGDGHPQRFMVVDIQVVAPIARALSLGDGRAFCRLVYGPQPSDGIVVEWGGSFEANDIRCAWMPCRL